MSGATQVETGYTTAGPATEQQTEVQYEYGRSQLPEAKRGRYGESLALHQANVNSGGSQSKKAIVVDATRVTGRCLWFDTRKNYGAIQPDQSLGTEGETGHTYIFVHGNDVEPGSQQLRQGDIVEFCRGTCPRGRPKAAKVTIAASSQYHYHANGGGQGPQRAGQQLWAASQQQAGQGAAAAAPQGAQQSSTQAAGTYGVQPYGAQQQYPTSQYQQYATQQGTAYAMASSATSRRGHPVAAASGPYAYGGQQQRPLGRVKWFDRERKQYGFITPADGSPDLFMHAGDVLGSTKTLGPGDAVEFDYGVQAQSGRPKALEVVRLVQHVGDDDEDDGRTTIGKFASGDEPLFDGARVTGTVVRFDQQHRWGFIRPDDDTLKPPNGGDNFFVHGLDVLDISDAHPVDVDQSVEFSVVRSRSRRCKAVQCLRVDPANRPASPAQQRAAAASPPPAQTEATTPERASPTAAPASPTLVPDQHRTAKQASKSPSQVRRADQADDQAAADFSPPPTQQPPPPSQAPAGELVVD